MSVNYDFTVVANKKFIFIDVKWLSAKARVLIKHLVSDESFWPQLKFINFREEFLHFALQRMNDSNNKFIGVAKVNKTNLRGTVSSFALAKRTSLGQKYWQTAQCGYILPHSSLYCFSANRSNGVLEVITLLQCKYNNNGQEMNHTWSRVFASLFLPYQSSSASLL